MFRIYFIVLLTGAFLNLLLALGTLRYYRKNGSIIFGLLLLTNVFYSLGYAFELISTNAQSIFFWLKIEYLGISFTPALIIFFALQFVGRDNLLKPLNIFILFFFSLLTLVFQYTTVYTGFFYKGYTLDYTLGFPVIVTTKAIWYWVHQAYVISSFVVFEILFAFMAFSKHRVYRRQAIVLIISSLPVWGCYLIYITGNSPYGIDLIPLSFSVVGIIWAWAMYKYKLGDFLPLAHDKVFDSMTEGVIICDLQWRVTNFNPSAAVMFKGLSSASIGKSLLAEFDAFKKEFNILTEIDTDNSEIAIDREFGKQYYNVAITKILNNRKDNLGKTLIITDITERKKTELKLIESEKKLLELVATKDKFFSIIGHDLRGPIGNILNLSDLLSANFDTYPDDQKKLILKYIGQSASNSTRLLENLLLWSQSQRGKIKFSPESFDMATLAAEVIALLQSTAFDKNITLLNLIAQGEYVVADKNMIATVIRNLLSNAIKFSFAGSKIEILCDVANGNRVFKVRDYGVGIMANDAADLFKIDKNISTSGTANETGSGLGLIICREFIQKHKGNIWVESETNKGTVFAFSLLC